jgi:hypothetical protein
LSKKLVLDFFELYSMCLDYNPRELYSWYVNWIQNRRRRRVSFRRFLFLLNVYLEEKNTKKLNLEDYE